MDYGTKGERQTHFTLSLSPPVPTRVSLVLLNMVVGDFSTEQRGADADHGGALGDGQFEVVAHTHTEVAEVGATDLVPAHLLEDFTGAGEGLADLGLELLERAHGHEANELEVGHGIDLLGQVHRRPDGDAELARLLTGVDLEQQGDSAIEFAGLRTQLLGESKAVDAVDQAYQREHRL